MAYRYEKNENGERDLVIDGWEKGIAPSPFKGIGNLRNVNIKYYEGVSYVNYKRQKATIQNGNGTSSQTFTVTIASPGVFTATGSNLRANDMVVFTTTGALPTGLSVNTVYFVISSGLTSDAFQVSATKAGSAINTSGSQSGTHTFEIVTGNPQYYAQSQNGLIYISDDQLKIWKQVTINGSIFKELTGRPGESLGSYVGGLAYWNNYLFSIGGGDDADMRLEVCGDGLGDSGVNSSNWNTATGPTGPTNGTGVWPIVNATTMTLTGAPAAGSTSATIQSYTDAQGVSRSVWNGPSGFYNMSTSGHDQVVLANLIQGEADFTFTPAFNEAQSSTAFIFYNGGSVSVTGIGHPSLVAANDGDLYFCNGPNIGAIKLNPGQVFVKGDMDTFTFYSNILALPPTETSIYLTELKNQLIIMGRKKIYPWDFFSPAWQQPVPLDEFIYKSINILNNIYIFAGVKGNIYISNGYSAERYAKLPDYIAGVIDPQWQIGGIMQHRQKLEFQALAKNGQTGSLIFAGVFSLDLDNGALNMENEYSGGLAPTGLLATGILIDVSDPNITYDKYYSGYSATVPRIEFNDTTLYSDDEVVIETDIIPVGTFLQSKTYASAEFKLDQPLQDGDSITLYARNSLSDAYTELGTTTSEVLSDIFQPMPIQKMQWIQFKVVISCNPTATDSSFVRLREIRIR